MRELARVVRPGGTSWPRSSSAFRAGSGARSGSSTSAPSLPLAGRLLATGWHEVGALPRRLDPRLLARFPLERQLELWREAGIRARVRRLSLGGGVVVWGTK